MQSSIPSLPSLKTLPFSIFIDGAVGYLYAKVNQKNPRLMMVVFTIRTVAHTLFYLFFNFILKGKDLGSQKIFVISSTITSSIFIVALKELHLIEGYFSILLGLAIIGQLINRFDYIQKQEILLYHP